MIDRLTLIDKAPAWVPVELAAQLTEVSPWTIRYWMREGRITTCCGRDHHLLVHWPEVHRFKTRQEQRKLQRHALVG